MSRIDAPDPYDLLPEVPVRRLDVTEDTALAVVGFNLTLHARARPFVLRSRPDSEGGNPLPVKARGTTKST